MLVGRGGMPCMGGGMLCIGGRDADFKGWDAMHGRDAVHRGGGMP